MVMGISGLIADKNMNPITDPSPTDVVEDLKALPDNILAQYAQDGNNPNATYALTVLMSRKRAKDSLNAQGMDQSTVAEDVIADVTRGPQSTQGIGGASMFVPEEQKQAYMAQQLMQQTGPQGINTPAPNPDQLMAAGGLAQLPAENIGKNYAGGGIVSFDEGGGVGSTIQSRLFGGVGLGNSVRSKGKGYPLEYYDDGSDFVPGANSFKRTNLGLIDLSEEDLAKLSEQDRNLYLQAKDLERRQKNKILTQELYGDKKDMVKAIEEKQEEAKAKAEAEGAVLPTSDIAKPEEPTVDTSDLTSMAAPESKPTSSYLEDLKEQYKQAGVNEDFFKQDRQDIEAEKERLSGRDQSDIWMNVTRAGLAAASGTSRNAMENITKGLGIGFEGYIQDTKERQREEKELNKLLRANKLAEQTDAKGDVREAVKIKQEADKLANDLYKNRLSNQTALQVAQVNAAKKGDYEKFRDFAAKDKSFYVKDATTGELRLDDRKVKRAFDGFDSKLGDIYKELLKSFRDPSTQPEEKEELLIQMKDIYAQIGPNGGANGGFSLRGVKQ